MKTAITIGVLLLIGSIMLASIAIADDGTGNPAPDNTACDPLDPEPESACITQNSAGICDPVRDPQCRP